MYRNIIAVLLAFAALWSIAPASAQSSGTVQAEQLDEKRKVQLSPAPRETITEQDIVVTGTRLLDGAPPISARDSGIDAGASRGMFERAERFARCADRPRLDLLRRIVDGPPNEANTRAALDRLIRTNVHCYPDLPRLTVTPPELGSCHAETLGNPNISSTDTDTGLQSARAFQVCRAPFTRGAVLEQVLRTYAPDLTLSQRDTLSEPVRRRFDARERDRNRYRLPRDKQFFAVAACLTQAQPELAVMLMRSEPAGELATRIQETMFARAPYCVGFASSVKVDPALFRIYIVDAIYRWTVAARDVDSLLPAG